MPRLSFISDTDLINHVRQTLNTYKSTLKSINLAKFNSNIIDPIKLTFDSKVYNKDMEQILIEEIARQRDKTNTNAIGYFHQNIFKYFHNCIVPKSGFDIVYSCKDDQKIYVELKNKHNTMNSSSSQKTYMKFLSQVLNYNNCQCYLVEIIAKKSQNIPWTIKLDGKSISNDRIKRVSIDKFYEEITGEENAFYNLCDVLPHVVDEILLDDETLEIEEDSVIVELKEKNPNLLKAIYLLAFPTYNGYRK